MSEQKTQRKSERRSAAEWLTLLVSAGIVLGLIGLVLVQFTANGEVRIEVRPLTEELRESEGLHYLPLEVTNHGGQSALDVVVRVTSGDESVDIGLDVVAGSDSEQAIAVFRSRPSQVDAQVISFRVP